MLVFIPTASKGFLQFCVKAGTFREQLVENKYNKYPYKYWDLDLPLPCRLQLIMSGKHIFQKNQLMNKDQKIRATDNINFGTKGS